MLQGLSLLRSPEYSVRVEGWYMTVITFDHTSGKLTRDIAFERLESVGKRDRALLWRNCFAWNDPVFFGTSKAVGGKRHSVPYVWHMTQVDEDAVVIHRDFRARQGIQAGCIWDLYGRAAGLFCSISASIQKVG